MKKRGCNNSYVSRWCRAFSFFILNNIVLRFCPHILRKGVLNGIFRIRIGSDSSIAMGCFFTGTDICIGKNTVINRFCYVDGRGPLYIGNNVNVSHYTIIHTLTHVVNSPHFTAEPRPVAILDHAWIGARAIILPGVTIGEGAVIGAGSTVSRDIPPYSIAVGNPAQIVGQRSRSINYKTKYFPFFDTDIQ